jgi:phosphatidylserine/phosphatidylglycerophosphate/cardiolipin synthase-like enzyme
MRAYNKTGSLSVHAIAGAYVILLGIDMEEAASEGVLGFGIERIEHGHGNSRVWLPALKVFPDVPAEEGMVSTEHHPIQGFFWGDFTTRYGHEYTYRIVAMRGEPGALRPSETVEVRIATEKEDEGQHAVYFNRGVAGSQAYVRKFGDRRPSNVPNREAFRWLSRGLFRAMLDFIHKANGPDWGLRVAAYELQQGAVLNAFRAAADSEADVKIIFDAREKTNGPADANWTAIQKAKIDHLVIPRTQSPSAISHNKFIVLLHNGEPVEVWTGSTNFTDGGIFGHSNCGHIVRNKDVAAAYFNYWEELHKDPEMKEIRPWNEQVFPIPDGLPAVGTGAAFSPRSNLDLLRWYARLMDKANTAVFLTAAFGVNDLFEEVLEHPKPYLRYILLESADKDMDRLNASLLNELAVANILPQNEFERWMEEHLSGLNTHVKYIHTKYMIIDPLGKDPLLITGSANFSDASTRKNDENMLVIRGDKRVADIYLSEFMRLFNHFQFRGLVHAQAATGPESARSFLIPNDSWKARYYRPGTPKYLERLYFAGHP